MKALKILGSIIIIILILVALFLIVSFINHKYQLRKEAKAYLPPGRMVEVNKKLMHVYAEGTGNMTLVFMAGHGTSSPTLDFKPLWVKMIDDYRIVVIEKSGYGWSETSNSPRDIDTMLEETRKALDLSGENGPYILFPHSMSGLEAIYWAQKYPDEVKAIIGLDPTTPGSIKVMPEPSKVQLYFLYFIARTGLSRLIPESEIGDYLPLMKSDEFLEEDKNQYLAIFYKSTFTKDMLSEVINLKRNAEIVAENEVPFDTPMYFFISDVQEASAIGWKETLSDYLSEIAVGKYLQLNTGHYVHHDKADIIAEEAKEFLRDKETHLSPELEMVKAGGFQMGDEVGDLWDGCRPVHTITLTYDFWIGKYPITFEEYDDFCLSTERNEAYDQLWGREKRPVINVNWWDAIAYCNWLSEKEGLKPAYTETGELLDVEGNVTTDITKVEGYRLLTEAEWEYAASGGHEALPITPRFLFSGSNNIDEVAWYSNNSGEEWEFTGDSVRVDYSKHGASLYEGKSSHPVGLKKPNELGVYDMSGNVWEWCHDWYDEYLDGNKTNPIGAPSGHVRVMRGGSWIFGANDCRVACRLYRPTNDKLYRIGFRVARTIF